MDLAREIDKQIDHLMESLADKFDQIQQRIAAYDPHQPNENVIDTSTLSLFKVLHWLVKISTPTLEAQCIVNSFMEQGLARNGLTHEELRSVKSESPRFYQALADGMGLSSIGLLAVAADRPISTTTLVKAMLNQAPILAEEAGYQRINGVYVKEAAE